MSTLTFLGTAGGRMLVFRQLRASGGLWFNINGTNVLIDPGPGALIRCYQHDLDPQTLDAIVLSHKHLDHSADVNVIIEAVSQGGFFPRGVLLAPNDCYDDDPVVLSYNRDYLEKFLRISEGFKFELNGIKFEFPLKHEHGVETYGIKISTDKFKLSHIVDTKYFDELIPTYKDCDILLMNMVFNESRPYPHLAYEDIERLIQGIQPKLAVVTHFGYKLWKESLKQCIKKLNETTGITTIGADDGMKLDLENAKVLGS